MSIDAGTPIDEQEGSERVVRVPPRFWWLKRICAACVLLLVVLAAARWWCGRIAHSRLQAEIDRIRAAGEPIFPEDFDSPPVPDAENAAPLIQRAINALVTPAETTAKDISTLMSRSHFTPAQLADARLFVDVNTNALRLARRARSTPQVDWGMRIRNPAVNFIFPSLSGHRQVGRLLAVAARVHHRSGDEAEAIGTIRDLSALGNAIDHQPTFISHLVAISTQALTSRAVESIAPDLVIRNNGKNTAVGPRPAPRNDVEALMDDLLDEDVTRWGFIRALQSERMFFLDMAQLLSGEKAIMGVGGSGPSLLWETVRTWLLKPLVKLDSVEMVRYGTAWVEAAEEPTFPAMWRRRPPNPLAYSGLLDRMRRPLGAFLSPSSDRAVTLHCRSLADRRMAAIALAIRLYEVDHGRRPEQLTDLAPEYLKTVPADPFGDDGRTIGYRPDADPPVLYSIGSDGVDNNGAFTFRPRGGLDLEALDQLFFLDGHRPEDPEDSRSSRSASEQAAEEKDKEQGD